MNIVGTPVERGAAFAIPPSPARARIERFDRADARAVREGAEDAITQPSNETTARTAQTVRRRVSERLASACALLRMLRLDSIRPWKTGRARRVLHVDDVVHADTGRARVELRFGTLAARAPSSAYRREPCWRLLPDAETPERRDRAGRRGRRRLRPSAPVEDVESGQFVDVSTCRKPRMVMSVAASLWRAGDVRAPAMYWP